MSKNYYLSKKADDNNVSATIDKKLDGFIVKPKNEIEYDGIKVNYMMVIKPSMIEKVVKKKIKKKLNRYLKYIISLINDDSENDSDKLEEAINDLERYKSIIKFKYRKYLEEKYVEKLLKKFSLIENELKLKQENLINIKEMESKGRGK